MYRHLTSFWWYTYKRTIYSRHGLNNCEIYKLDAIIWCQDGSREKLRKQGNQRWQTSPAAPPGGLGHCQTGMCMSNFMMIGWEMAEILHIEISWKHVSVTYDLDLWPKILKIFVSHRVPILNVYVKFHDDRLRNDWDNTLLNFAKTRTNTHTHKQTNKQTWALQYLALPLWGAR